MKQRFAKLTRNLCWRAVDKLLSGKWWRGDVHAFIEEWTGYSRYELREDAENNGQISVKLKAQITDELAMVAEDMVDGIMHGIDPDFNPVESRPRKDGLSGKIRDIACLDIRHQMLGHLVKLGIDDLLRARILPTQHASIPHRGQTGLTRQVRRYLNRKLGIRCYVKTDCTAAYASTQYKDIIDKILLREIPRARWIIACMYTLARYAPGGHLIIGGYLDAWLFNLVMSYALRYVLSLAKYRRFIRQPMVVAVITYMDDGLMLGRSRSSLKTAVGHLAAWLWATYHISMRTTTGIILLESIAQEKSRKHAAKRAARHPPLIDMGGYRICRTFVAIRRKNVTRVLRCFVRAWRELKALGTLKRHRACQVISRFGMIANADSYQLCHGYHVFSVVKVAKRIQGYWARITRRDRKETNRNALEKYRIKCAAYCRAS